MITNCYEYMNREQAMEIDDPYIRTAFVIIK